MVWVEGFELSTSAFQVRHSNQAELHQDLAASSGFEPEIPRSKRGGLSTSLRGRWIIAAD